MSQANQEIKLTQEVQDRFRAYLAQLSAIQQRINEDLNLIADMNGLKGDTVELSQDLTKLIVK